MSFHATIPPTNYSSRLLGAFVGAILALYLFDTLWFQLRLHFARFGHATGSIHRTRLLAIAEKGGKTEYQVDSILPEEDLACAHAIFPHAAIDPCWYVARHAKDPIPM